MNQSRMDLLKQMVRNSVSTDHNIVEVLDELFSEVERQAEIISKHQAGMTELHNRFGHILENLEIFRSNFPNFPHV